MSLRSTRDKSLTEQPLRLHMNENPYGCSLLVYESLAMSEQLTRVQGSDPNHLVAAIGRYAQRSPDEIYVADTLNELLFRIFFILGQHNKDLFIANPVSEPIRRIADLLGLELITFRTRVSSGQFAFDSEKLLDLGAKVVYIQSPHDITGAVAAYKNVVEILNAGVLVIVDEIYSEFTERPIGLLGKEFPNLISIRSFAPWAGLWGIPVSYALMSTDLRERLNAIWPIRHLTAASRIAAGASLDDAQNLMARVRRIRVERGRLYRQLRKLNFVEPLLSQGPFVTCKVTRGTAAKVCDLLKREGILIYDCANSGLPGYIRVSVGTPENTDQLIATMCRISVEI